MTPRKPSPVIARMKSRNVPYGMTVPKLLEWMHEHGVPLNAELITAEDYGDHYVALEWPVHKEHHFHHDFKNSPIVKCGLCKTECYGNFPCTCCAPGAGKLPGNRFQVIGPGYDQSGNLVF